jgi:inorganic triphosphatase YgiF
MAGRKHHEEIEQEIKIRLSAEDLEKVFNVLSHKLDSDDIAHKYLPRDYYDTDALDLHQHSISLRMQYKPGKGKGVGNHEQTVKFELPPGGDIVDGALYRKECKDETPGHAPDLALVSDREARKAVKPFLGKPLRHIFTAAIERRFFEVEAGHGKDKGTVEVAFDVGEIILQSDGSRHAFHEIEIERKSGSAAAIARLRDRILEIAPSAKLQPLSKSQQGSALYLKSLKKKP